MAVLSLSQYLQEIKKFLADPKPEAEEKPQDAAWSDEPSEVAHLTDDSFARCFTVVLPPEPYLLAGDVSVS